MSTAEWLGGLDPTLGNPDADSNALPLGVHRAVTEKCRIAEFASKDGRGARKVFLVTFRGVDGPAKDRRTDRRVTLPAADADSERKQQALDSLARLFKDLGVPKERMNSVQPDDLNGIPVTVQVYDNKQGYRTVGKILVDRAPRGAASEVPLSVGGDNLDLPDDFD